MLMNFTLIPFLLGIRVYVRPYWDFDPEYLYVVNQTKIEYGEITNFTEITSTIICQPFLTKDLHCFFNDVMAVTSTYTNLSDKIITQNIIKVGRWFQMKFNDHGLQSTSIEHGSDKMIGNLIPDVINQFNVGINTIRTLGANVKETTRIGVCTTKYNMNMRYNPETETDSSFQIKLAKNFFNGTESNIRLFTLHIEKDRKDCKYLQDFTDFLNGGEVTKYVHTIKVIDDKLKMFTILDGRRLDPQNPSKMSMFTEITQLNLINIRSEKSMVIAIT